MRSLTLCLRNINSLRGEHVVDFTDPVLAGVDLFGITGPTGSGKSTLLDAITLALYGRVVRHGGGSSPEPSVSTHTADASAVYRFSVQGVVHEARWSMRRARGRLDGAFQQPVRELLRFRGDGSSESLAEGNAKVNTAVEELLGLGFEQFQRVALLPQGEFDRFLTSNETDRAGILEKLTGTGPYHVYGHRIHEKWVEAKTEVESIRNWMGGVEATLMTDEARAAAEADRDNWQREHVALSAVSKSLAERLSQANQLAKALDEQASCTQQERDLQREIARNDPEMAKVRRWRALEPAYRAESLVRSAGIAAGKARRDAVDAREQAQDATGRWKLQQAQALDFGKRQMLQDLADARRVARRYGFAEPADIARAVGLAESLGRELQRVSQALVPCVAAIDARELAAEKHWRRLHKVANSPAQLSGLEAVPAHGPNRRRLFDETLGWASGRVPAVAAEAELSKKVAEVALAASAGAKTIVELKRQLAEGGQCGVCGSDIPSGRIAAIPSVEDLESAAEEAQAAWEKAVKRSESIAQWMDWVRAERLEWETATRNAELAEGKLAEVLSETGLCAFAATPEALETVQESIGMLGRVQLRARQSALLDRMVADGPVECSEDAFSPRDWSDIETAVRDVDDARRVAGAARERSVSTDAAAEAADAALREAEVSRTDVWRTLGVVDEAELASLRLEPETAASVEETAREHAQQLSHLRGRMEACAQTCARLRAVEPSLPEDVAGRNELTERSQKASADADNALAQESALAATLREDARNRERIAERAKELEVSELRERRWRFLREHFGKDRLTKKVQELTMGALVSYANMRLSGFTGRYELTCDASKALEIRVRDRARLDALRPTAGLSGGEKFLVSLSLALGLSDIASRSSRIESLFIDEGFGTLDADTLETALATLQQLRSESGRQVGIISHVGALQERLSARIRLVPRGDGNSHIRLEAG